MCSRIIGVRFQLIGFRWGGARGKPASHSGFLLALRAGAGICARRRSNFLSRRRKKVTKERATLLSVTPTLRMGATCDARSRGALRNSLRAGALRSNSRSESVDEGVCPSAHARPAPCASRYGQKGTHGDGPSLRSAPPALRTATTAPSAAMARVDSITLLDAPVAMPWWGGVGVSKDTRTLRKLTRRGCPNAAPQARSEFHGAPRQGIDAGCPVAQRRGRRQPGRLLFGDFLLAAKRKLLRRRAHIPASALNPSKQLESDPNCLGELSKTIAASAYLISVRAQKHHKSTSRGQP